mgnify:CR=1 FL=1
MRQDGQQGMHTINATDLTHIVWQNLVSTHASNGDFACANQAQVCTCEAVDLWHTYTAAT